MTEALPRLRGLIMCLCSCRPVSVHVGFVVGTVAPGQIFIVILWFSSVIISTKAPYVFIHLLMKLYDLRY
jgi:hypothetical protein